MIDLFKEYEKISDKLGISEESKLLHSIAQS